VKATVYVLLIGGAFVLASLLAFWLAVRPPRLTIPLSPRDVGLAVEEVTVRADDGVALAGWLAPRPGAPAVIVLHGYPAEKTDMLPLAAALAPRFTVLLMDLRYFGASGGAVTTLGLRERGDLRRAVDVLVERGAPAVGVFGFSLGGAVALLTAAEDPRLRAVAAYAPFADLRDLGHDLYWWLGPLRYALVGLMRGWSWLAFRADLTRPAPEVVARRLAIPVLLIASRADEQIPFAHAERLRAALAGNPGAESLFMERGRHGELPDGFAARLADFFARHLHAAPAGR
jgi:pimeloyl-ACP methyl ester carboxylesterase